MRKIRVGQELTANYADLEDGLNLVYRQPFLLNNFNFQCFCECCSRVGSESDDDEERRREMMMLHHQLNTCHSPGDIIKNINKQLKLSKHIPGVKLQYCLNLVSIGYHTVAESPEEKHNNRGEVMRAYAGRAKKMSKILYGNDYCVTQYWNNKII